MSAGRLDAIIWTLIYGGLVLLAIGLAVSRADAAIAAAFFVLGGAALAAGIALVVVRSRTVGHRPVAPPKAPPDSSFPPA